MSVLDHFTPASVLAEPPEPLPTIPGIPFAYAGASVLISGPTGGGRSSLVEAVLYDAVREGGLRCAYISGEITLWEFNARATLLAQLRGDQVDHELDRQLGSIFFADLAPVLQDGFSNPLEWAEVMRTFDVVAIDPLSSVGYALGLDFDSNRDYVRFHERLIKPLTDRGVTVLLVENMGHGSDRAKGASAKNDKADAVLSCRSVETPEALRVVVKKVRSVGAPFSRGDVWIFRRDSQRLQPTSSESTVSLSGALPKETMEKILQALEEAPGLGVNEIRAAVGGNRDTVNKALRLLVDGGDVEVRAEGKQKKVHYLSPVCRRSRSSGSVGATGPTAPIPNLDRSSGSVGATGPTAPIPNLDRSSGSVGATGPTAPPLLIGGAVAGAQHASATVHGDEPGAVA